MPVKIAINYIQRSLRTYPVVIIVALLTGIGLEFVSPESLPVPRISGLDVPTLLYVPVRVFLSSLLHNDLFHWGLNLMIWVILGHEFEAKYGSIRLIGLYVLAVLLGGLVEGIFVDLSYVGLSPVCYALIAWLCWESFAVRKGAFGAIIALGSLAAILLVETFIAEFAQSGSTAIGAHIGGSMAGLFSALGIGARRSANGLTFRPMRDADVGPVLDIIYDFDEDDGEEAEESFARGLGGKYVVEADGQVIGMSGYTAEDQAQGVVWLSWTYVHKDFRRHGAAFFMMQELRLVLEKAGMRKVFIATSDYKDEDTGEDVYAPARRFYQTKLNATREIVIKDYYDVGESKYIYSLPVIDAGGEPVPMDRSFHPVFLELEEADESETGYVILWEETTETSDQSTALDMLKAEARSKGAHALFLTLTSSLSDNARSVLSAAGFSQIGTLSDFYALGVDDVYWGLYFEDAA